MNLVQITAGTGNYHCDTCLRDHALVRAMRQLGHDVMMVPLYLPLVTELPDDHDAPLFLGGINAYLQQKIPLFRHTPTWLDRLFDATWLLRGVAGLADMTQPRDLGEMTISTLSGLDGNQRKELQKLIDWLRTQPRFDVICLSNALLLGFAEPLRKAFGVPIICTLQGSDSFVDSLPDPYRSRSWEMLRVHVQHADAFIAVSDFYAGVMGERMSIPPAKLHTIRNGIDVADLADIQPQPPPATIGYFSQMTPTKGLGELVDAFIKLHHRNTVPGLRLCIGGSIVPAWRRFVNQQKRKLQACGTGDLVSFEEILDRRGKLEFMSRCTLFSVPTQFPEPFGVYAIEAIGVGTPVVLPERGAFPELIALTGGGVCYQPHHPEALPDALESLLLNADLRESLGRQGKEAVQQHFKAERMAKQFADVALRCMSGAREATAESSAGTNACPQ